MMKKAGLVLLAVVVALGLVEVILWAIGYSYTPLSIKVIENYSEWRYFHAFEDKHFEYDPDLIWRPKANAPGLNAQGYRGKVIGTEKAPGEYRIFAIGDSNTLGWIGKEHPHWPGMLEQELNKKEPGRFTVTNAGVYGYTSFQGVRRFNEALQYQPDLVLVSFGCNDGMRVTVSDAEFASRPVRKNRLDTVLYKTHTGQLVLAGSDKLFTRGAGLVPRVSVEEYKNNLNEIIRVGRERGIKVVLLTRPFTDIEDETHDENWWKNFAPEYNAATKEVGAANGITVIDIAGHFADKKDMFADESHFTKEGFQLAAKMIHDAIRPLITNPGVKP